MFMHYALNYTRLHGYRMAADNLGADMNDLPEIEDGLKEIEEALKIKGRHGDYWDRIRAKVLECSSTQDVDEALKEWTRGGNAYQQRGGVCQLCGHHPIVFHYPIKNRVTGVALDVGSECVWNYLQIAGFRSPDDLRRILNGERIRLLKVQKGEISQDQLETYQQASDLATKLSAQYAALAVGGADFDFTEYQTTLNGLINILSGIDPKNAMLGPARQVLVVLGKLQTFHDSLKKRSKRVSVGPLGMVKGAISVHSDDEKLSLLERIQSEMGLLLQFGDPTDFVNRLTDAITDAKDGLLRRVSETANAKCASLEAHAKPVLDQIKRYPNIKGEYELALEAIRVDIQKKADDARQTFATFIEGLTAAADGTGDWSALKTVRAYIDSPRDAPPTDAPETARQRLRFIKGFLTWQVKDKATAIGEHFLGQADGVRDVVGVKVAVMRAIDEVFMPSIDTGYISSSFMSAITNRDNQRIVDIIEDEVDDVKQVKKKKLYQFLGERWGVDLQKAFSAFSADNRVDFLFCEGLIENWQRFPKLGPAFMGKIKMKMGENSRAVPNSAWDKLKGELTRTVD